MRSLLIKLNLVVMLFFTLEANAQQDLVSNTKFEGKTLKELVVERRTKPLTEHNGEEHLLMFMEQEIMREFEKGDLDKALSYLDSNAMVSPPGIEAIFGRENQKNMFKQILSLDGVVFVWEPIQAYVNEGDKMGYVYGLVIWKMPNEKLKLGKYISIYQKIEGKWMNQVEMRNIIKEEK